MCIGNNEIWHGELDLLAGNESAAIQVNTANNDEEEESVDQELIDTPGYRPNMDMKNDCIYRGQDLCQIVGQAIVFAWTEYNRHPEKSPLIPTILIRHEDFTFFIYNPKTDELYSPRELTKLRPDENSPDKYAGIVLMWILLNHHLFFRHKLTVNKVIASGFSKSNISKYSLINEFVKKIKPIRNPYEFVISAGRRGLLQRDNLE
ncbi:uncharacterized protein LOC132737318 [Ruditapes philippinarum]|uniref:uncharacterized protein LOC132737318 n=1 Tax=Ruditapes philippinarum TaxID=129788 RepID=UPI00295AC97E|nr:uncharacterized protein LOC132737318 [Ruditapes philippinarum]